MEFCRACEEFVEAKLTNWYIRRNRDRFWSANDKLSDAEKRDKLAAYQTLHTVLVELAKLIAPVTPFLAEVIYRPLASGESVHLADYPMVDPSQIDDALSDDMNAALRIISLGLGARSAARAKVRQPLKSFSVFAANDVERRATARFAFLIADELNVKEVSRLDAAPLTATAKLNKKTAAAKLGPHLRQAEAELAAMPAASLGGPVTLAGIALESSDYVLEFSAPAGFAGLADRATQVLLDIRITPDLKAEGMARDVVRLVQDARKEAGLDVADKIVLHLEAHGELAPAIDAHRATIESETQVVSWSDSPPADAFHSGGSIDGQPLVISLARSN
jgi:isoleucyl-tRNA synthetase